MLYDVVAGTKVLCHCHNLWVFYIILTDTEPPSFANCPSAVREVAYLSIAYFPEPTATDNVMVSDLTVTPNDYRVSDVVQTDLQVSYIARDHASNIGTCDVNIRVRGQDSLFVLSSYILPPPTPTTTPKCEVRQAAMFELLCLSVHMICPFGFCLHIFCTATCNQTWQTLYQGSSS